MYNKYKTLEELILFTIFPPRQGALLQQAALSPSGLSECTPSLTPPPLYHTF